MQKFGRLLLVALLGVVLAACGFSPEDGRARGGGVGASSNNFPAGGVVPKSKVFSNVEP
jgi:hypothetical protein